MGGIGNRGVQVQPVLGVQIALCHGVLLARAEQILRLIGSGLQGALHKLIGGVILHTGEGIVAVRHLHIVGNVGVINVGSPLHVALGNAVIQIQHIVPHEQRIGKCLVGMLNLYAEVLTLGAGGGNVKAVKGLLQIEHIVGLHTYQIKAQFISLIIAVCGVIGDPQEVGSVGVDVF